MFPPYATYTPSGSSGQVVWYGPGRGRGLAIQNIAQSLMPSSPCSGPPAVVTSSPFTVTRGQMLVGLGSTYCAFRGVFGPKAVIVKEALIRRGELVMNEASLMLQLRPHDHFPLLLDLKEGPTHFQLTTEELEFNCEKILLWFDFDKNKRRSQIVNFDLRLSSWRFGQHCHSCMTGASFIEIFAQRTFMRR